MILSEELSWIKVTVTIFTGFAIGILNALFGAGGGILAVPIMKSKGKNQKEAQASALGVILPISIISATVYRIRGYYTFSEAAMYIPFALLGGIAGTFLLKKIPDRALKKLFSFLMIYMGIRLLL